MLCMLQLGPVPMVKAALKANGSLLSRVTRRVRVKFLIIHNFVLRAYSPKDCDSKNVFTLIFGQHGERAEAVEDKV